jgi:hypothetical protein
MTKKRKEPIVSVMVAVNDPDTGHPCDRLAWIEFGDMDAIYASPEFYESRQTVCRILWSPPRIRVGRRTFRVLGWRHHVGNWCWDRVTMHESEALRLCAHIQSLGYQSEGGTIGSPFAPSSSPSLA